MNGTRVAIIVSVLSLAVLGYFFVENKKESVPVLDNQSSGYFMREVEDREILTDAIRPDVVAIKDRLYLAYNKGAFSEGGGFHVVILDKNLNQVISDVGLEPKDELRVTDVRTFADDQDNFWYAYESVEGSGPGCGNHFVNGALYDQELELQSEKRKLSAGCTSGPQRLNIPKTQIGLNPEIADDPSPFFYHGKYYILSRAWEGPVNHMRVYDRNFSQTEYFTLDISKIFKKDEALSQNDIVDMGGVAYIISGIHNGPPRDAKSQSYISAIPLRSDLKNFSGQPIKLTNYEEYNTRVTSAQYQKGILYVNYQDLRGKKQYLEAFDAKNNFKSLGRVKFQDNLVGDGHSSFVVLDNKIYLFYNKSQGKVNAKVLEIGTPGGKIETSITRL